MQQKLRKTKTSERKERAFKQEIKTKIDCTARISLSAKFLNIFRKKSRVLALATIKTIVKPKLPSYT